MSTSFKTTWESIPYVTKYASLITTTLFALDAMNPMWAARFWVFEGMPRYEIYRYLTAVFGYHGSVIQGFMELIALVTSVQQLEVNFFKKRSVVAYYLLFVGTLLNLLGPKLNLFCFLPQLNMALSWTLAQENPFGKANFFVVQIDQRFSPYAQLAVRVLLGGYRAMLEQLVGILSAHLFLFLTELLGRAGGPKWFEKPPFVVRYLDVMEENYEKEKVYGRARRLGK